MLIETILEVSPDPQCLPQAFMSEKSGISTVEYRAHTQESQLVKMDGLTLHALKYYINKS